MSPTLIRSSPYSASSLEGLHAELATVVFWCEERGSSADPGGSLRRLPDPVDVELNGRLRLGPESLVWTLSQLRSRALNSAGPTRVPTVGCGSLPGRLLVFFPDEDLNDGAAELASEGFFDDHNTPPWDTWVGFFSDLHEGPAGPQERSYLLAYVPKVLVPHAQRGLDVNPEECIQWLDESETALAALLRAGTE